MPHRGEQGANCQRRPRRSTAKAREHRAIERREFPGGLTERRELYGLRVCGAGTQMGSLMLVGHNDGIHQFALALAGVDDLARLAGFPPGALALFEFDIASWRELRPRTGRLAAYVDPDQLVEAA